MVSRWEKFAFRESVQFVLFCTALLSVFLSSGSARLNTDIRSVFTACHNVVDRGVLQAMWEELAGQVVHRDQLIICKSRLSENAL